MDGGNGVNGGGTKRLVLLRILLSFIVGVYLANTHRFVQTALESTSHNLHYRLRQITSYSVSAVRSASPSSSATAVLSRMLGATFRERERLESVLRTEYGRWYPSLFCDPSLLDRLFVRAPKVDTTGTSMKQREGRRRGEQALRRRMMLKIIRSAVAIAGDRDETTAPQHPQTQPTFTWVTNGGSSAAALGISHHTLRSYTAVLEDTVRDSFAAVGVRFVAINRAKGIDDVGEEDGDGGDITLNALCLEEEYDDGDVDVLARDFHTGRVGRSRAAGIGVARTEIDKKRLRFWTRRAERHANRPIPFLLDEPSGMLLSPFLQFGSDLAVVDDIDTDVVRMDSDLLYSDYLMERIPISGRMSDPFNLPPGLRYFKCEDPENPNGPGFFCERHKWDSMDGCEDERFRTEWHLGRNEHLLRGHLLGIYLIDVLNEALLEINDLLTTSTDNDPIRSFRSLQTTLEEREAAAVTEADRRLFPLPSLQPIFSSYAGVTIDEAIALERGNAFCRSAFVPSMPVTIEGENGETSSPLPPTIVVDHKGSPDCKKDEERVENHHNRNAFFRIGEGDGWRSVVVGPSLINDDGDNRRHSARTTIGKFDSGSGGNGNVGEESLILICLHTCPPSSSSLSSSTGNGKSLCPPGSVGLEKLQTNGLRIRIDGVPVVDARPFDRECYIVAHEGGRRWDRKKSNMGRSGNGSGADKGWWWGGHEVLFRLDEPGTKYWLGVSSIVVVDSNGR